MPNDPTFSIITCTWNSAATLGDTLTSLRGQTCQDFEHIFVDGGSTDATLAMLEACEGDKRILRGVGGGISCAMNAGIHAARGDVVAHLHGDDYYASEDVLATVAARFSDPRVDWVVGQIQVLKDGKLHAPHAMRAYSYRAYAAGKAAIAHPAVFIRRSALARAGLFDETLTLAMDIDLWLRLGQFTRPVQIGRPLAVFREHASSVSSANKIGARQEEFRVRQRYFRKAPLAFCIYCLRYLKHMRALQRQA
ncbi:MAG: glycosyltransferase [Pseudomonadota bacterium]